MEEQSQAMQPPSLQPVQSVESPKKPFPRKLILFVFGLIILFLILGSGLLFLSQQNQTAKTSPTPLIEMSPTISSDSTTTTPTCIPRPSCLDAEPRCLILETPDMCQPTITPVTQTQSNPIIAICVEQSVSSDARGGFSFEESFCQGDYCLYTDKASCVSQDVVKVEGGRIVKGKDGIVDCSWDPSLNTCGPVK